MFPGDGVLFTLFWRFLLSVESRMPAEVTFELKLKVLTLRSKGYSYNKIVKKLCEEGDTISKNSVIRVIARDKDKAIGYPRPPKKLGTQNQPTVRTKAFVRKVSKAIQSPNPPTHGQLSRRFQISKSSFDE